MQKKLMLRPTAVPSENLPTEMTNYSSTERSDSPENTSSSFVSLDHHHHHHHHHHHQQSQQQQQIQSTDNSTSNNVSTPQTITIANGNFINNNNSNAVNNNSTNEYSAENYTSYHPITTPIVQTTTINTSASFQASTYETLLTPLSTVPYQEITEEPIYVLSDGTEIDRNRLSNVLNKDDFGDGTITYVVNFVDY